MSQTWEEIANDRMKEINRLRQVVREQSNTLRIAKEAAEEQQTKLARIYNEDGRTEAADYAVNHAISAIITAITEE
jgi:hypothetical protein